SLGRTNRNMCRAAGGPEGRRSRQQGRQHPRWVLFASPPSAVVSAITLSAALRLSTSGARSRAVICGAGENHASMVARWWIELRRHAHARLVVAFHTPVGRARLASACVRSERACEGERICKPDHAY